MVSMQIYIYIYTIHAEAVGITAPNPYLFHYFLWKYIFDLGIFYLNPLSQNTTKHIKRAICICKMMVIPAMP